MRDAPTLRLIHPRPGDLHRGALPRDAGPAAAPDPSSPFDGPAPHRSPVRPSQLAIVPLYGLVMVFLVIVMIVGVGAAAVATFLALGAQP